MKYVLLQKIISSIVYFNHGRYYYLDILINVYNNLRDIYQYILFLYRRSTSYVLLIQKGIRKRLQYIIQYIGYRTRAKKKHECKMFIKKLRYKT